MEKREYGSSKLSLPVLGFGAGLIGDAAMDENYAGYFINQIVDLGITFIDTARGYGLSEERIGRHLSWRRNDFILSTKVGYGILGCQDWTKNCIIAGVHHALQLMRTDHLDIVHLHSCSKEILERGDVILALQKMVQQGYVRVAAYSGENDALEFALQSNQFNGLMSSINVFDQQSVTNILPRAVEQRIGYIAKRPVGNAPWLHTTQPFGKYCEEYWKRMKIMMLDFGEDWLDIALRFTAYTPGVSCSIVGTTNLDHVKKNIAMIHKGALPNEITEIIQTAFVRHSAHWKGEL